MLSGGSEPRLDLIGGGTEEHFDIIHNMGCLGRDICEDA